MSTKSGKRQAAVAGHRQRLMLEMFEWGREFGCAEAWVATEFDNEAARGLYRSLEPAEEATSAYYVYKLK